MPPLSPNPGQTTPAQAHQLARAGAAVLLDVRERGEFTAGHAPGALHLPLIALAAREPLPPEADGLLVLAICHSGNRSGRAAQLLAERGVEVLNVVGGMAAWERGGLPVTTPGGSSSGGSSDGGGNSRGAGDAI
ncbi:rhodanese-like domain-containing protein [Kitasatospora sp. NPDC059811]|uniref:rhodanese-like domain-containing protein n=1 Tax=Streptomycetaceae TaxID=2062 RepID=UPI0007AEFE00|nr:rhodanese-like domain-containing protein [Streptomyces sp. MJM8645]